jgi:CRISPR-associated protein Csx17
MLSQIALGGCTPEPLMSYLKALGVLRVLAEQADPQARGCWRRDVFVLTSMLDRPALLEFFADRYRPTPILSPWNADAGFLDVRDQQGADDNQGAGRAENRERASAGTLQKLKDASPDSRLANIARAVKRVQQLQPLKEFSRARAKLVELEKAMKARHDTKSWKKRMTAAEREVHRSLFRRVKDLKQSFVFQVRASFPEECLPWLDACLLVDQNRLAAAPLLGSGGSDGRMEFSATFLSNVLVVTEGAESKNWLEAALFGDRVAQLLESAVGQFAPGGVGGPNASHGLERESLVNPWDYVLMIEGLVLFSGAVSRRLSLAGSAKAAFPFTVLPVADGAVSDQEERDSRGEVWFPLWHRPASLRELRIVLAEGRAEWGGRQSRTGVDFARAVASLGVDRGITQFTRVALLKRSGLAFLATPLERVSVAEREAVHLLREMDGWLDRYRWACRDKNAPPRFRRALRQVDHAILEFCRYGGAKFFQAILVALGRAERELATGDRFRSDKRLRPIAGLAPEWADSADDGSPEFDLARALAGMHDPAHKITPLRSNLEAVKIAGPPDGEVATKWADRDRSVVWNSADLAGNLAAILARRLMDGAKAGCHELPLAATSFASMDAVARFIARETDDARIAELLWGLILVRPASAPAARQPETEPVPLPRTYALLKLLFLPDPIRVYGCAVVVRPEPAIVSLLLSGRIGEACRIATRRLRSSGFAPLPHARGAAGARDRDWEEARHGGVDGRRLAAALLMPMAPHDVQKLATLVLRDERKTELAGREM